jgi:hypothetical protein
MSKGLIWLMFHGLQVRQGPMENQNEKHKRERSVFRRDRRSPIELVVQTEPQDRNIQFVCGL